MITDTNDKEKLATTYYGHTGYWHVREQQWVSGQLPLALRVHLGDLVDVSQAPWLTRLRFRDIMADYQSGPVPFLVTTGTHDDNYTFADQLTGNTGRFL
ncbi:metallophosphoesterase, partial [Lacticaseibacillus paracasei]